jgi:hypothetical protein
MIMENIKKFLIKSGYEIYELDDVIEGNNEFLHILIAKKDEGKYLVRNAVRCYFDRWANSGIEFYVDSEDEVIRYFSDNNKCIPDAVNELVCSVVEESVWDNSDKNIRKMIDELYSLVRKSEQ